MAELVSESSGQQSALNELPAADGCSLHSSALRNIRLTHRSLDSTARPERRIFSGRARQLDSLEERKRRKALHLKLIFSASNN
jgi:hypothetical protein